MIASLSGTIEAKDNHGVVVSTAGGVGYFVSLTPKYLHTLAVGSSISLPTYLRVTDSALDLFGFESLEERDFFKLLLSVSGVGPKTAMNVLSLGSLIEIKNAIGRGDAKYLTAVQGMGAKTAERLCVELKSKVGGMIGTMDDGAEGQILGEVIDGLVALGYSKEEARTAAQGITTEGKDTEAVMREVLRKIGR